MNSNEKEGNKWPPVDIDVEAHSEIRLKYQDRTYRVVERENGIQIEQIGGEGG